MYPNAKAFETENEARDAVAGLLEEGFPQDAVVLLSPAILDAANSSFTDAIAAEEVATPFFVDQMDEIEVSVYNEAAKAGKTLLVVGSNFGESLEAQRIMNRRGAIQYDELRHKEAPEWLEPDAAPFSTWLKLPTLLPSKPRASLFNGRIFGLLPLSTKPGYTVFGDGVSRDNPAPLSTRLGMETLSDQAAPLSAKLGKDTLSKNTTPFSSLIGWKTLSKDGGGEWKTSFGLPLLIKKS